MHKRVDFVHFIWLCPQKAVPLRPIFKIHIIYIYNMALKIVVLAKQVPDTRNVGKDAMTAEGTVNRAALPAIFNLQVRLSVRVFIVALIRVGC